MRTLFTINVALVAAATLLLVLLSSAAATSSDAARLGSDDDAAARHPKLRLLLAGQRPAEEFNHTCSEQEVLAILARLNSNSSTNVSIDWNKVKCFICEKVIMKFVTFAVDHGCAAADGVAAAVCSISGPAAPFCAAALIAACQILVSHYIGNKIHNGQALCKFAHMC
jgi:hypothetical protein